MGPLISLFGQIRVQNHSSSGVFGSFPGPVAGRPETDPGSDPRSKPQKSTRGRCCIRLMSEKRKNSSPEKSFHTFPIIHFAFDEWEYFFQGRKLPLPFFFPLPFFKSTGAWPGPGQVSGRSRKGPGRKKRLLKTSRSIGEKGRGKGNFFFPIQNYG